MTKERFNVSPFLVTFVPMAEIIAINNTGSRSIIGRIVKTDTRLANAYTYTRLSDTLPLGVVANATPHKSPSRIATSGVAQVSVVGRVKRNDPIRLAKTGDIGVSQGQCVVAKTGDAPYLKVGTAQANGAGLVPVSLEWAWVSAGAEGDELLKVDQTTPQTTLGTLTFPQAKFGTSANYTHFEADGTMVMYGDATVWDDIRIIPNVFDVPGGTDPDIIDYQPGGSGPTFKVYAFAKGDMGFFTIQLPHSYLPGSSLYAHVHWTPGTRGNEENGSVVQWRLDYSFAAIGQNFPIATTIPLPGTCSGIDHKHEMTAEVEIPGTGLGISSQMWGKIYRWNDASDTWAGTGNNLPIFVEFDIHFQLNSQGSRLKTSK